MAQMFWYDMRYNIWLLSMVQDPLTECLKKSTVLNAPTLLGGWSKKRPF